MGKNDNDSGIFLPSLFIWCSACHFRRCSSMLVSHADRSYRWYHQKRR